MSFERINGAIRATGLIPRGGFHPGPGDRVPSLADGSPPRTLVLVGNAGDAMWEAFSASAWVQFPRDPLDHWTVEMVSGLAQDLGGHALYPFEGPPYLPFQRWARRADTVWPSPIGPLIHPEYGLWHAYRAALVFAEHIELPVPAPAENPCESCRERPCLTGCPVGAFQDSGYDVAACASWLGDEAGAPCMTRGCRARRVCPVGREYQYSEAQARLHMRAFLRSALARR